MGLFDVNMPLMYGEGGEKAFARLQLELIASYRDNTIFMWQRQRMLNASDGLVLRSYNAQVGLLARSPSDFQHARTDIRNIYEPNPIDQLPLSFNKARGKLETEIALPAQPSGSLRELHIYPLHSCGPLRGADDEALDCYLMFGLNKCNGGDSYDATSLGLVWIRRGEEKKVSAALQRWAFQNVVHTKVADELQGKQPVCFDDLASEVEDTLTELSSLREISKLRWQRVKRRVGRARTPQGSLTKLCFDISSKVGSWSMDASVQSSRTSIRSFPNSAPR